MMVSFVILTINTSMTGSTRFFYFCAPSIPYLVAFFNSYFHQLPTPILPRKLCKIVLTSFLGSVRIILPSKLGNSIGRHNNE